MSFTWSGLHGGIFSATLRRSFHLQMQRLRMRHAALECFPDAAALLRHQHGEGPSLDARNAVLRALVEAVQARGDALDAAQTLLILSLWPGLDAARMRLRRRWRGSAAEIDADLVADLINVAGSLDLRLVTRVAATLLRNVERDLGRRLARQAGRRARAVSFDPAESAAAEAMVSRAALHRIWHGAEAELDTRRCADRLNRVLGKDAALVQSVLFHGWSQAEAGAAMGLAPDASRKRFQRAVARLREADIRL